MTYCIGYGSASMGWFHLEPSNLVRIVLAFLRERCHLELILKNCAGDSCLAGAQESNRRAEEARQSLFLKYRSNQSLNQSVSGPTTLLRASFNAYPDQF